ncbi:lipopolysaccharide assembly LapA domain-containing protein [Amycolatopsis sp. NPDC051758]|uniref:lipopolysaccharide assembly LapA domain-containing protein n=1 Tax=Amycolatopsis sp. NPDC051758 TaxID=3363935 RepID=UPI0037B4D24E
MSRSSHDPPPTAPSGSSGPPAQDLSPLVRTVLSASPTRSYRLGVAVGALLAVSVALLIVQNGQSAGLSWLGWQFQVPLWLILLLAVAAGAVLMAAGVLLGMRARSRRDRRSAAAQRLRELADPAHPASPVTPAPSEGVPSPRVGTVGAKPATPHPAERVKPAGATSAGAGRDHAGQNKGTRTDHEVAKPGDRP